MTCREGFSFGAQHAANTTVAALARCQRWRAVAVVAGEVENALRVQTSYPWRYMGYGPPAPALNTMVSLVPGAALSQWGTTA